MSEDRGSHGDAVGVERARSIRKSAGPVSGTRRVIGSGPPSPGALSRPRGGLPGPVQGQGSESGGISPPGAEVAGPAGAESDDQGAPAGRRPGEVALRGSGITPGVGVPDPHHREPLLRGSPLAGEVIRGIEGESALLLLEIPHRVELGDPDRAALAPPQEQAARLPRRRPSRGVGQQALQLARQMQDLAPPAVGESLGRRGGRAQSETRWPFS